MSKVTDLVEEEAARAEAEEPEPDAEPEPEPIEPEEEEGREQSEAQPITEAEVEKRLKKLTAQAERHTRKVAEIMGDDFALLIPSPIDWTPGFVFDPSIAPIADDQRLAALALLGADAPAEYLPHPTEVRCETCAGLGKLATGSFVPNQEALNCPKCNGMGHHPTNVATFAPNPQTAAPAASELPITTVPLAEQYRIGHDAWGRPPGDLHYGVPLPSQAPASA